MKNILISTVAALAVLAFAGCAEKESCDTAKIEKKADAKVDTAKADAKAKADAQAKADAEAAKVAPVKASASSAADSAPVKAETAPAQVAAPVMDAKEAAVR